jgi:hypothetical protein
LAGIGVKGIPYRDIVYIAAAQIDYRFAHGDPTTKRYLAPAMSDFFQPGLISTLPQLNEHPAELELPSGRAKSGLDFAMPLS